MTTKIPMTIIGAEKLRIELDKLKQVDRQVVIKAIAEARAHGDLKENAEYHAAKEQQGFIEGRIKELEAKLSRVQIIDVTKIPNQGRVIFGATVHLVASTDDSSTIYRIVGEDEADIKSGKISVTSPVARGLIGKNEGDSVEIITPGGQVEYYIEKVEYI
jgi:transcription elongation factor GreA